jgi:hypothetical protein
MDSVRLGNRYRDMLLYVHRVGLLYGVRYRLLHRDRDSDRLFHRYSHCLDDRNEHRVRYLDVHRDRLGHRNGDWYGMRNLNVLQDRHRYRVSDLHCLGNGYGLVVSHESAAVFVRAVAGVNPALILLLV